MDVAIALVVKRSGIAANETCFLPMSTGYNLENQRWRVSLDAGLGHGLIKKGCDFRQTTTAELREQEVR